MAHLRNHSNFSINTPTDMSIEYDLLYRRIAIFIYLITYALGFVGNTFAFITFSSHRMRQISSSIFLLVLSVSDFIALLTSLWFFLADFFGIQLQNYSALACRFRMFFAYVFMDLSSWCIAGLAFDRYLRTKLPLSSRTLCTPRNASRSILIIFLILCVINGHYFSPGIGQERGDNRSTAHCLENRDEYPRYYIFYKVFWPKIDMAVFCFLPACVMILCYVKIICLIKRQRHHWENPNGDGLVATKTTLNIQQTLTGVAASPRRLAMTHRKALERQMLLMTAACVIAFLCTTLPITISLLVLEQLTIENPSFAWDNPRWIFIFRILRSLMYTHFGSNFYLYCLTSRIFRAEFIQTITCRKFDVLVNPDPSSSMALNKIDDL